MSKKPTLISKKKTDQHRIKPSKKTVDFILSYAKSIRAKKNESNQFFFVFSKLIYLFFYF